MYTMSGKVCSILGNVYCVTFQCFQDAEHELISPFSYIHLLFSYSMW